MASALIRGTCCKVGVARLLLGKQRTVLTASKMAAIAPMQAATLRATYGESYGYEKPYPYKEKTINVITEFFDNTEKRMNENSKVILVEGNVGVGKADFARRLAHNFDLQLIEPPDDGLIYMNPDGFDMRQLDHLVPDGAKSYDLKRFLTDPNLAEGKCGRLQLLWYYQKFIRYCQALTHLLNTGQGVVLYSSVHGDIAWVEALRKVGWISKPCYEYYHELRDNTMCELLKPHVTIYLDAPLPTIRERIGKSSDPLERESKNLPDKFLEALDESYRTKCLPPLRVTGEVLEVDWAEVADDMDMEVIVEEMTTLNLECTDNEDKKFHDWYKISEDQLCHFRKIFADSHQIENLFKIPVPLDAPEIFVREDDLHALQQRVYKHPAVQYKTGWAPELGNNVLWKLW